MAKPPADMPSNQIKKNRLGEETSPMYCSIATIQCTGGPGAVTPLPQRTFVEDLSAKPK